MKWAKKQTGFTIVELLIVVVVIAILAAITIVAFNGVQNRSRQSAFLSSLSQMGKQLEIWKYNNGEKYPASLSIAQSSGLLTNTSSITFSKYIVNSDASPSHFCASATNGRDSYTISSTSLKPIEGECVTNLIPNPKATTMLNWTNSTSNAGASVTDQLLPMAGPLANAQTFWRRTNSTAYTASPTATSGGAYTAASGASVASDTQYTVSAYMRTSCAINGVRIDTTPFNAAGTALTMAGASNQAISVDAWSRISRVITTPAATQNLQVILVFSGQTSCATGTRFDGSGVMLTQGGGLYSYGDGDSPGWF